MSNIPYLSTVEEPGAEPLALEETKTYLRVDGDVEDDLIEHLIKTSRQIAEEFLGKSLITQTLQLQFDYYTPPVVNLLRGPVQEVVGSCW